MKISILLPYKENFSPIYPGAVSLFVNDTVKISKYKKDITIYGNTNYKTLFNLNYKNIALSKFRLQSSSKKYVYEFLKIEKNHISDLIDDEEFGGICDDMVALFDETFPSNVKEYENMSPLSDVQDLDNDNGWNEIFPMEKLAYFE